MEALKKKSLSGILLRWYQKNKRVLPWRLKNSNPYKTWISEVLLQQTQVKTVIPHFKRFLKTFPTVVKLALASVDKVLTLWSGLGYYSRARNLHKTAKIIVHRYNGIFPGTKEELLRLPGIGEYTAGAIASIAFGERVPVVDGNVIRVLTRIFALRGDPRRSQLKKRLWHLAGDLLPERNCGDFNQALMELGAGVCLPKSPRCGECPLKNMCEALKRDAVSRFPSSSKKKKVKRVFLTAALIRKNGTILLAKRGSKRHLQSMWEFPQTNRKNGKNLLHGLGIKGVFHKEGPIVRHSIMNRRIKLKPVLYHYIKGRPKCVNGYAQYRWIKPNALKRYPTSSLNHKVMRQINFRLIRRPVSGGLRGENKKTLF